MLLRVQCKGGGGGGKKNTVQLKKTINEMKKYCTVCPKLT